MAGLEERPSFEILEHTADIGLRARGKTPEELFENAAAGLLEILIYLVDARGARIAAIAVRFEAPTRLRAGVTWTPSDDPLEGSELKAATFHQLSLEERSDAFEATVFFDV